MSTKNILRSHFKKSQWYSSLALSVLVLPYAQARTLNSGETETITSSSPVESWQVAVDSVLNVNGATTQDITMEGGTLNTNGGVTAQIDANNGATVNLNGATVIGAGGFVGVSLINSAANIKNTSITGLEYGLQAVRDVDTQTGSTVDMQGSTVRGNSGGAVATSYSSLNLRNSVVEGTGASSFGLSLHGGQATVSEGSKIIGGLNGVTFGSDNADNQISRLVIDNSSVEGKSGVAIVVDLPGNSLGPLTIDVRNKSSLQSGINEILKVAGGAAVAFTVDNSSLQGNIKVESGSTADVTLRNQASLIGDLENVSRLELDTHSTYSGVFKGDAIRGASVGLNNGSQFIGDVENATRLELDRQSSFSGIFKGDTARGAIVALNNGSKFNGDVENATRLELDTQSIFTGVFKGDSVRGASVLLNNGSLFNGDVENVTDFTLNHSTWVMTGDNQIHKLAVDGGTVDFGQGAIFIRLDVAELEGNGTLAMSTDFGTRQTDFLNVTGRAEGNYEVSVNATGSKPVNEEQIQLVKVGSGDAQFALRGGAVDAGARTYKLFEDDNGWYLRPDTQASISTQSVLAIANTAPTIIDAERTLLNTRMGDRRMTGAKSGVWTRAYGNRYGVKNAYGDGYSQTQKGVVVGADTNVGNGEWLLGGMFGYSNTKLDLRPGSTGTVDSYSLGAYLTKFDTPSGVYIDAVTKINRFENSLDVSMSDGVRTKGDYDNYGLSGSLEVGKQNELCGGYFWAPFAQIAAAVVPGEDYTLDNGLDVNSELTRSLAVKGGTYVGSEIDLGNGQKLQPRLRLALGHEFIKNNQVDVNDSRFNNDASTTSVEVAAGLNWALPHGVQLFAEAGTSQSKTVSQDYNVSTGISFSF
ncbi:outer membrane autotransporter protein [Pseudomonas corrugata]|uniref:autotransporter outer membrane beta-barrel domain-containing protein n=1 Tax=Pseudomonas corrugata TaxID=47879 RepID=UPI002854EA2E|nr:autotransporter outer membrane beta-barrel domain-containing protein [Pseudomonas corrugata]MDR7283024.1 outer membrane autotransporter protein [Pseudomonas corrugata]